MNNRFAFALAAALAAGVGSASAADLPRKAPMAAPVVAPVYNWTGFYIGVHAGYAWTDSDSGVAFPGALAAFGVPFDAFGFSHDSDGFLFGGQIGFNYQVANWVFGVEADLSWTDISGGFGPVPLTTGGVPLAGTAFSSAYDMEWFGTLRGRLGFAANNLLLYVTGGLAWGDIDVATATTAGGVTWAGGGGGTEVGWTIGAGVEWGFAPNWSLKLEYLYYDLDDVTLTVAGPAPVTTVSTYDNDGHIVRLGVNYRFGFGGPVVARY
jgi:outer membrane immunogenic protein